MTTETKTCKCNTHTPGCPTGWDIYREWESLFLRLKAALDEPNNGHEVKELNEQLDRKENEYTAHRKAQGER